MKNLLYIAAAFLLSAAAANAQDSFISGTILTLHEEAPVPGVSVQLYLDDVLVDELTTTADGNFNFTALTNGETYRMELSYDTPPLQGLSTLDLVHIAKHILATQLLPTPHHMIAADFNNSGNISVLDIVRVRRVILGIENPEGEQWVFVPQDYGFDNSPVLSDLQLNSSIENLDIYAIKRGDVAN
ncbi:MAG TPA: hypothetical protein VJ933_05260 [Phaeodactylibacter sp.]|nr:hypothetical protein [Phaeodactylibacter sp.]